MKTTRTTLSELTGLPPTNKKHRPNGLRFMNGQQIRRLQRFRNEAYKKQKGRCFRCNKQMRYDVRPDHPDRVTAGHIIPHAQGGLIIRTNIVAECFECNNGKKEIKHASRFYVLVTDDGNL
jgi:5-methylcytosine-specific restriction endonuclease McrA